MVRMITSSDTDQNVRKHVYNNLSCMI